MSTRKKVMWWIGGAVIVLYALFPIAWIISISLKAPSDIANGQFTPTKPTWENYTTILTGSASDLFLPALRNSFGICLIATAVSVLLFIAVVLIAMIFIKGFKVDLSQARGE